MPYCPECGGEHKEDAKFCPECGHDLGGSEEHPLSEGSESSSGGITAKIPGMTSGSTIRNVVVGVIWVFAVLIIIGALAGSGGTGDDPAKSQNTPEPTTHSVGETFRVGEGAKSIEYTITDVSVQDNVGSGITAEEADGVFVVIQIEMTNVGDESLSLSSNVFTLVDNQDRGYDTDSDAILAIEDNVIFEQLDPGVTKEGTLVFDVPQDQSGRELKIEPAGIFSDAKEHYVSLDGS